MKAPTSPAAARAIHLFDSAPRSDRFHVRARWWTCPIPAVEQHVPRRGHILEVGCGHGLLSLYLALSSPDRQVVGIDIDEHKIGLARQAASSLKPDEASVVFEAVTPGTMPPGPFDAIVINDVLYLLPAPARHALLEACVERLAAGGVLVVKELDTQPRWKYELGRFQELLATKVFRYTQGEQVEIVPLSVFADQLTAMGLSVDTHRVDRGQVHPHRLLVAHVRPTA
jgi:2-polyprenyl-3-methyl-5-hydroxy-6-metoxy-1,4-benzoquinol methylase